MGPTAAPPPDRHQALVFGSDAELAAAAGPALHEGLSAGETVLVRGRAQIWDVLHAELSGAGRVVHLGESRPFRRPAAVLADYRRVVLDELGRGARAVRIVGEVPDGVRPDPADPWFRYETVLDHAMASVPVTGLCAYDLRRLPQDVVDVGSRVHRTVRSAGGTVVQAVDGDLPPAPADRAALDADRGEPLLTLAVGELHGLRRAVRGALTPVVARTAPPDAAARVVEDFVLAVNEIVANGQIHGDSTVVVRLWADHRSLRCTVTDRGPGIANPLAGYGPQDRHPADGGQGLWLARQLCDDLVWSRDAAGFTVCLTTVLAG